jgi:hypothetical protein
MHPVLDFHDADPTAWAIVNDGVMGGRSSSQVERTEAGTLRFSGHVSLENSGGFASTRTELGPLDLSGFRGLALRVRGDGRRYQLRLRMDPRDPIAYKAEFQPTFRGRRPLGAPPLDPGALGQLGFLIADEREGPFRLEVDWIAAHGDAVATGPDSSG